MKTLMLRVSALLMTALVVMAAVIGWSYHDMVIAVPTEEKIVALSFDDGPHPIDTLALLEVLAEKQVRATFFLMGRHVEAYPDIAVAIAATAIIIDSLRKQGYRLVTTGDLLAESDT